MVSLTSVSKEVALDRKALTMNSLKADHPTAYDVGITLPACRQLKERVLRRWRGYVPLAREEREREVRRAGLRRKVSQWLPDYQPMDFDQENQCLL